MTIWQTISDILDSPFMWILDGVVLSYYTKWLIKRKYRKIKKMLIKEVVKRALRRDNE